MRLHTGNFTFDGISEKGADIRFVAADDQTVLNHQLEAFDPLLGIALIWVDVPELADGQRQDIWMYYGNQKAPASANGQLTFDPNYTLVYHFDGAAGAPPRDTTAYSNHAQTPTTAAVDGVIGRAAQFAGGAPLMLPASPSLAIPAAGSFTFSAWVRADQPAGEQLIYARRDAGNSLLVGINQGVPFVEVNGQRSQPGQPLAPAAWQHVAVTADGSKVNLYVNGRVSSSLAASLPPLNTVAALGGDVPAPAAAPAASAAPAADGQAPAEAAPARPVYAPFVGAIDEVRLSKIARPAALILADATAQGAESRLVAYGTDEEQSGFGFGGLGFLLKAVPIDAWVIIAILVVMMVQSWFIMIRKSRNVARVARANDAFRESFAKVGKRLELLADDANLARSLEHASLWRLYRVAVNEIRTRREQGADTSSISAATIEAIRASMDAVRTKENQVLGAKRLAVQRHRRRPVHRPAGHGAGHHGGVPGHGHGRRREHQRHRARHGRRAAGHRHGPVRRHPGPVWLQPPGLAQQGSQRRYARVRRRVRHAPGRSAWRDAGAGSRPPSRAARCRPPRGPRRAARRRRSIRRSHGFRIRRPG